MSTDAGDRARRQSTDQRPIAAFPVGAAADRGRLESDHHATMAELRQAEPVSWIPALGCWLITSRELASAALKDSDRFTVEDPRFSTGQVLGPSMLTLEGAEHRRHRSPFAAPFRAGPVLGQHGDWIRRRARGLIQELRPNGVAELRTELAGPLAVSVIARVLGLANCDEADILRWYRAIVDGVTEVSDGRPIPTATDRAVDALKGRVSTTAAAARDTPENGTGDTAAATARDTARDGTGSSLLRGISAAGTLSEAELFSNTAVLMFGAIETSEGMTANALYHLLSHPDRLAEVDRQRSLIDNAIEESLRMEPAAAVVDRYATADVQFGPANAQARITKGDLVRISLAGANRDPDVFQDPDRFDIHRHNAADHLAFVHGPHACLGLHLARLETRAAIDAVLDLLPGATLDRRATTAPRGQIFRKPARVTARW